MSDRTCTVDGCEKPYVAKGWCNYHYHRLRDTSHLPRCAVSTCDNPVAAKGWCVNHYYQLRNADPCAVEECERPAMTRGYCRAHRKRAGGTYTYVCPECGVTFTGDKGRVYCSRPCLYKSAWGPMQRAVKSGDPAAVLAAIEESTRPGVAGCREWKHAVNGAGYPVIGQGASGGLVHRHVLAASLGKTVAELGKEPVHHKCANPPCINPEHLQQVTHHDNMAEMLARQFYVGRIAELEAEVILLEAALREASPNHPLLSGQLVAAPPPDRSC